MNDACLADHMEYRGQYRRDIYSAYDGCKCANCRRLREASEPVKGVSATNVAENNMSFDRHNPKK